jgi:hypothetical protein
MSESLERRPGLREHLKVRLHLLFCASCAQYLKQIRFLRRLARSPSTPYGDTQSPVTLTEEARERISQSLRQNYPVRAVTDSNQECR